MASELEVSVRAVVDCAYPKTPSVSEPEMEMEVSVTQPLQRKVNDQPVELTEVPLEIS